MIIPEDLSWKQATDLTGKVVVVTGCASGIGRATAMQFAGAGAVIYGGDIDVPGGERTVASIREAGGRAEFLPLDLANPGRIDAFADDVLQRSAGAIDVIASIAGVDRSEPFLDSGPQAWDRMVSVNFVGAARMIHRLLPAMIARGAGGKVLTVASDAGRVGASREVMYSGTKGALIAFTKSLAREMARHRICCNCVSPGPVDTPLFTVDTEPRLRDALVKSIPLRRLATPVEIANTILFLAAPAADYITGQVLSVSGGLTMSG